MTRTNRRPSARAAAALEAARKAIGVREKPAYSNDGPEVGQYLRYVGLCGGNSWNMAFVSFMFSLDAESDALERPTGPLELLKRAKGKRYKVFRADKYEVSEDILKPGDIFIQINNGIAHCGFIEKVSFRGNGIVSTIEGNTAIGDECPGVYARRRNVNTFFAIVRVLD